MSRMLLMTGNKNIIRKELIEIDRKDSSEVSRENRVALTPSFDFLHTSSRMTFYASRTSFLDVPVTVFVILNPSSPL